MQVLALTGESTQDFRDIFAVYDIFGVEDREFLILSKFFSLHLLCQRREALETPLLIRYALEAPVAILCDLLLPALLSSFPLGPCLCGFLGDLVDVANLLRRFLSSALTVYESLSRCDRQEEEAHTSVRLLPCSLAEVCKTCRIWTVTAYIARHHNSPTEMNIQLPPFTFLVAVELKKGWNISVHLSL
jgi:hypothetical protein